jgi:hypothetical protein
LELPYQLTIQNYSPHIRSAGQRVEEWTLGVLPGGRIGALLVDEAELMQCLAE